MPCQWDTMWFPCPTDAHGHLGSTHRTQAKVAHGSSVPISPETTAWRTQSVQLDAQSGKDAFLQGSLNKFKQSGKQSCLGARPHPCHRESHLKQFQTFANRRFDEAPGPFVML